MNYAQMKLFMLLMMIVIWPHQAAIEHFDEQLLGVNVDFGAVKVTVGHLAVEKQVAKQGAWRIWRYTTFFAFFELEDLRRFKDLQGVTVLL